MKKIILLVLSTVLFSITYAQKDNFWSAVNEKDYKKNLFANRYRPAAYQLFSLNKTGLKNSLLNAPSGKNVKAQLSSYIITLPNSAGKMVHFKAVKSEVMDPALASKYPEIESFTGQGIEDPTATISFDISPRGFHAMILSAKSKTEYIDPVDSENNLYTVFSRKDIVDYRADFQCLTSDALSRGYINRPATSGFAQRGADDGQLRTYRLALACTGEYAQYFLNGTETTDAERKAKVLAAMVTLMVRTNGIYERDFGIHMNLIANNDAIIYLTAATDPWASEWNTKTQQTIDAVIGSANYDIGHLVHKGSNNGNAGCIGCVCTAGSKGSAFTSHSAPEGDPFVVDYTTHEMGHQFGGNHTFTFSNESGTAAQMEPGSGSTIMGYAGITGSTDVQPHSDDYFHARSIEQITDYIKLSTGGGACAVVTVTGNATPVANAGADYTIPKSTPFTLTGSGSDADGADVLSYTWEQYNTGTSTTTMPSATATTGPVFRSRSYDVSSSRTFPILASILDGTNSNTWEKLPSVARTLAFRFTVRDNHAGGGNTKDDDMNVTISSTAGPFAVTAPNTAEVWNEACTQTITWSVASTTAAPVNCANVKISLSLDGGITFPVVIAASTPNDGTEDYLVPAGLNTTAARIKIEAVGNIFFDISNVNFTITGPSLPPTITGLGAASACAGASITINGTNFLGAVAANVKIGGTAVSSITSNNGSTIVAVIGTGTTGFVTVTTCGGTATSATQFTVNAKPTAFAVGGGGAYCAGTAGSSITLSNSKAGINYALSTSPVTTLAGINGALTFGPTAFAAGTYTITATNTTTGCTNTMTGSAAITVNTAPTGVTAGNSNSGFCTGGTTDLTSSPTSPPATIISENFNGGTNSWVTTNSTSGGTPANAAWTLRPDSYVYSSTTFRSNDQSQFYLSNSDAAGSGSTTSTVLKSPSFSTVGYAAVTVSFYQYYRRNASSDSAKLEISTDNVNWTSLQSFTATQGTAAAFVQSTSALGATYLNQPTVYIRFRYVSPWGWYWAVDNVNISGTPISYTYGWTSVPAGFTSALQNPVNVAPLVTTQYIATITNASGCSASASTTVNVNAPTTGDTTAVACGSFTWYGSTYSASTNSPTHLFINAAGCDSIVTLHLTINTATSSSQTVSACDSYLWNGTSYTTSGVKTFSTTNAAGCDSTATLNLTIKNSSASSQTVTACNSYLWNGTNYTTSGVKTFSTTNAVGCDSTATLNLTINNSSASSQTVTACNSYLWNGTNYTTSGVKTFSTTNAVGCDSTATLNLIINNSSASSQTITACNSYLWNGTNYNTSGVKTFSTTNAAGCDSTATLHLTINNCSATQTLNLKLLLQGYYGGNGLMKPVLFNEGVSGVANSFSDSVTVELRDTATYALISAQTGLLDLNGNATFNLSAVSGNYYIVIKHRNAVETWSAQPVSFTSGITANYDFTTGSNKAFGNNLFEVETGIWALYTGDLNKDGNIDISDYTIWENDYNNLESGYFITDLNGDGNVDISDYTKWEDNYNNLIGSAQP